MANSSEDFSFEWEERTDDVPTKVHMIAGSIAGISEHTLLLPLDNMKTHLQTKSASIPAAFREIWARGPLHFYRGSAIIALGCVPSHALFFMNYEFMKQRVSNQNTEFDILGNMLVGGCATIFHDLIMTPCEMIKQRSQLLKNISYWTIIKQTFQKEGLLAFWRSFPVNFINSIPNGMIFVTANENLKTLCRKFTPELTFPMYFACASLSGMISALATTPLDNIKTRLNVQQVHIESIVKHQESGPAKTKSGNKGIFSGNFTEKSGEIWPSLKRAFRKDGTKVNQCKCRESIGERSLPSLIKYPNAYCSYKIIMKEEGTRGFFKGVSMRMGTQALSSAISWSIYEYCKRGLTKSFAR